MDSVTKTLTAPPNTQACPVPGEAQHLPGLRPVGLKKVSDLRDHLAESGLSIMQEAFQSPCESLMSPYVSLSIPYHAERVLTVC